MATKVVMFIEDNEFDDEYIYDGYFLTISEFVKFVKENKAVGNRIELLSTEEISVEEYRSRFQ